MLRDQNDVARAAVGRRQKATLKSRTSSLDSLTHSRSPPSIAIPACLPESEAPYSLGFFLSTWCLYPHDPRSERGFAEYLPLVLAESNPNSPLSLCVAAISSFLFNKFEYRMHDGENYQVKSAYGQALSTTARALQDPIGSLSDETLMAVCLLGFYQVRCFRHYLAL